MLGCHFLRHGTEAVALYCAPRCKPIAFAFSTPTPDSNVNAIDSKAESRIFTASKVVETAHTRRAVFKASLVAH
jgi:hypothetical protein